MIPVNMRLGAVIDRLREAGLLVSAPNSAADIVLGGITDDSRRIQAGDLFCAWAGTAVDAHGFVPDAVAAAAALVERPVPEAFLPQVVVRDGRRAAAHAAAVIFGHPADALTMVGVTGTNGKSTTVWLLRHMLELRGDAASLGTLGLWICDREAGEGDALTTPGPVEVSRTLKALENEGVENVALEVSSHALQQGRVDALKFDTAVFTNLTRDHLDYHPDEASYLAAKRRLADLLRPDGAAVVNADDAAWDGLAERAPRAVRYGVDSAGLDIRAAAVEADGAGTRFRLITPEGEADVKLDLLGDFNVYNALAAASTGVTLGLETGAIARRLTSTPQVPGRLERIGIRPCTILRDYAHTPDALQRALAALRGIVAGRLILVFGAGGDRDRGKRPRMGAAAEQGADVVIVTSDNPRTEDPEQIIDDVAVGMAGHAHIREVDRKRAIARALELAEPDDMILLAGKGHETYQVVGTERRPFDERALVRELSGTAPAGGEDG